MARTTLDKIVDRLSYSDGSGRRRFVAGGIVVVGLVAIHWAYFKDEVDIDKWGDILTSPVFAAAALAFIYVIGLLVEIIGEKFFVMTVASLYWALTEPIRRIDYCNPFKRYLVRLLRWIFVVPVLIAIAKEVPKVFSGVTSYEIQVPERLTRKAQRLHDSLDEKVRAGLSHPMGDSAEFALRHIVERFAKESDRKRAEQSIGKAKSLLDVVTALLFLVIWATLVTLLNPTSEEMAGRPLPIIQGEQALSKAIDELSLSQIEARSGEEFLEERMSAYKQSARKGEALRRLLQAIEDVILFEEQANRLDDSDKQKLQKIRGHAETLLRNIIPWERELRWKQYFVFAIFIIGLFVLYSAFFLTLKTAIIDILEELARKRAPTRRASRRSKGPKR